LRTKGEIENGLKEIGFKRISIFRPGSLRVSEQRDQEHRKLETISLKFIDIVEMVFPKKISVHVDIVGRAMREVATNEANIENTLENGTVYDVYDHTQIHEIGGLE